MKNSEVALFFLLFYNMIVTFLLAWNYFYLSERIDEKDNYISELLFELEKERNK